MTADSGGAARPEPAPLPAAFLEALSARLGDRFTTNASLREQHGGGGTHLGTLPPQGVAFPESREEVQDVVRACARFGVPVIPFGAGTSLECHVGAVRGGVSLDLTRMNRILRVGVDDLDCTVEPGVTRLQLAEYLRDTGLFFPVDPGADATLGGMAATRASGTTTLRYGGMRDNVLGLTVVDGEGRLIRTANRARKSSAGYDLTRLFVGSEGTLGVIVELTLRLHPVPEATSAAVCAFPSAEAAVRTVIETVQSGLRPARMEYLDALQMEAVERAFALGHPAADTLFLEFHGSPAQVEAEAEAVAAIAAEHGGGDFRFAVAAEERNRLWKARHQAALAAYALRPGCRPWITDVCTPVSRLAECVVETKADLAEAPFPSVVLGHVGDGNFHVVMLLDPDNREEAEAAARINQRMVRRALAMEGTCTGEHGIGLGKPEALEEELGEAVDLMRAIKRALDPQDLFNPGKMFRAA